jgi:uncharacterized protein
VVCRARQGKRALVRLARLPDGRVVVDLTGKGPGRGAYLCPRRACWLDKSMERRLEHALKVALTPEDRGHLAVFAATLPNGENDRG